MNRDNVGPDELLWIRPRRTDLGDLPRDAIDDDLIEVAAQVFDIRSGYPTDGRATRSEDLAAFSASLLDERDVIAPDNAEAPKRDRKKPLLLKSATAMTAGLGGKLVVGVAVAAASMGGLHVADVVEVPGLPEDSSPAVVVVADVEQNDDDLIAAVLLVNPDTAAELPGAGDGEVAAEEPAAPVTPVPGVDGESAGTDHKGDFSQLMQAWSDCVDSAASEHDAAARDHAESTGGESPAFEPETACGPRPRNPDAPSPEGVGPPQDAGAPEDAGPPEGVGAPEDVGRPEGVGRPDDVGPPEGVGRPDDVGPPEDAGPPEGVGAPEDVGRPEGVGRPDDVGPPEGVGRPDDVGPPEGVGRPDDVGPPEDAGAPADVGPPEGVGRPDDVGPPEGVGRPDDVGPPEDAGAPADVGPPEGVGRPDDVGPPEDAGAPEDVGLPQHAGAPADFGPPQDAGAPENVGPPEDAGAPEDAGPADADGSHGEGTADEAGRSSGRNGGGRP